MVAGWQQPLGTKTLNKNKKKKKQLPAGLASLEGNLGRRWEKERRGKKREREREEEEESLKFLLSVFRIRVMGIKCYI